MKNLILVSSVLFSFSFNLFAQKNNIPQEKIPQKESNPYRECRTMDPVFDQALREYYAMPSRENILYTGQDLTHDEKMAIPCNNPNIRDVLITGSAKTIRVHINDLVNLSDAEVNDMITYLNSEYAGTNIQFQLVSFTHHNIPEWNIINNDAEILEMKAALADNPENLLNIYVVEEAYDDEGEDYFGVAVFPFNTAATDLLGGIVIINSRKNTTTLPHEVGHCIGLYHVQHGTNEVQCNPLDKETLTQNAATRAVRGDFCDDTKAFNRYLSTCFVLPKKLLDCDGNEFKDYPDNLPWTNIMSYTNCRDVFTQQQIGRMHAYLTSYSIKQWLTVPPESATPAITFFNSCYKTGTFIAPLVTTLHPNTITYSLSDYSWNFGDGTSSTEENPTKTYSNPGTYNVIVTVTNNFFGVVTSSKVIKISAGPYVVQGNEVWNGPSNLSFDKIIIQNGATLTVNSGVTIDISDANCADAGIYIGDNSFFHVKNGATILLKGGSSLHVAHEKVYNQPGKLIVEGAPTFTLQNNNTQIKVNGLIDVKSSSTFTFNGNGQMLMASTFQPNITCAAGSSFLIKGSGMADKVLVVESFISPNVGSKFNFSIENGLVDLRDDSYINSVDANFILQNIEIANLSGRGEHLGVILNGQVNHTLKNLKISGGVFGIKGMQMWNEGARLVITDAEIKNCSYGVYTYNSGAVLTNVKFNNCYRNAWSGEYMVNGAEITESEFSQSDRGAYVLNNSLSGNLYTYRTKFLNNGAGIDYFDQGRLGVPTYTNLTCKCTNFEDNRYDGIRITKGNLNLNPATGGGHNKFKDNGANGINMVSVSNLNIYHGDNTFTSTSNDYNIKGTVFNPAKTINGSGNKWELGPVAVQNVDYNIDNSSTGRRMNISTDPNDYPTYVTPCGADWQRKKPIVVCERCVEIETKDFKKERLDKAIEKAQAETNFKKAIDLHSQILKFPIANPTESERELLNISYELLKERLTDAFAKGILSRTDNNPAYTEEVRKTMEVQDHLTNSYGTDVNKYREKTSVSLDRAATMYLAGHYSEALNELGNMLTWINNEDAKVIDSWTCYVNAVKAVDENIISRMDFENQLYGCAGRDTSLYAATLTEDSPGSTAAKKLKTFTEFNEVEIENSNFSISKESELVGNIPNPATNQTAIEYFLTPDVTSAEIRIVNIFGTLIDKFIVSPDSYFINVDCSKYASGIYFYSLISNSKVIGTQKLSIIK